MIEWQMFLVVEVDPCIEEMQFATELHAELIYNCCTEDLWRVIVRIPETNVVLNCFAGQEWLESVFNIDLISESVSY